MEKGLNLSPYFKFLQCDDCGKTFMPELSLSTCPHCRGLLDSKYDLSEIKKTIRLENILERKADVWRWKEFLPIADVTHAVRIGSGGSPLIACRKLAEWVGVKELWVKYEGMQPTASLKDRSFAVAVSVAKMLGVQRAITYSSGNAAVSLAAHASAAGMTGFILVNAWADLAKLGVLNQFSWPVIKLNWTNFSEVEDMLNLAAVELGLYSFVNFLNPWRHEAYQTYAFENWIDMGRRTPDHEIHPVGTGGGVMGSWKGWNALQKTGFIDKLPKMHGAQPALACAVVKAYENGEKEATPSGKPKETMAEAIANDIPVAKGKRPLKAVYESGGSMQAISEASMTEAIYRLGAEGICAEPSGATSAAAAKQMREKGIISPHETLVCTVTASGYKQPFATTAKPMPEIDASLADLKNLLSHYLL